MMRPDRPQTLTGCLKRRGPIMMRPDRPQTLTGCLKRRGPIMMRPDPLRLPGARTGGVTAPGGAGASSQQAMGAS